MLHGPPGQPSFANSETELSGAAFGNSMRPFESAVCHPPKTRCITQASSANPETDLIGCGQCHRRPGAWNECASLKAEPPRLPWVRKPAPLSSLYASQRLPYFPTSSMAVYSSSSSAPPIAT
jgi:hypothetical protein